ncbi:hypothetical protein A0O36_02343 [Piscirickettsiaceae bacterium NZ-RLO1]|nr:hypothetical protein A0O36_02343 [Piscirickettsiaceae bacterium NZ-RLO1]
MFNAKLSFQLTLSIASRRPPSSEVQHSVESSYSYFDLEGRDGLSALK